MQALDARVREGELIEKLDDGTLGAAGAVRCVACGHRCLVLRTEPAYEQILEIAERDSPIDRASRSEGDHQCVGAPGGALGPLGRTFDLRQALLENGDARRFLRRSRR